MLSIGEFARYGEVSRRMLRHYDTLGLLVPAHTDEFTGYRWYCADQLSRLNRLVALKDLGLPLEQLGPILDASIEVSALRDMLESRRAALTQQIRDDHARLAAIERRLRTIERESTMSDLTFTEKALPDLTVAQMSDTVADMSAIGATVGPLFGRLLGAAAAAGYDVDAPSIAWYGDDCDPMEVGVCLPLQEGAGVIDGTETVTLPAHERAVTVVHHGDMATIGDTWQQLVRYVAAQGLAPTGRCREVYLSTPEGDEDAWVTELQQPVHA